MRCCKSIVLKLIPLAYIRQILVVRTHLAAHKQTHAQQNTVHSEKWPPIESKLWPGTKTN